MSMSALLVRFRPTLKFRSSDLPIVIAGLFILTGMICWIHNQTAASRAITITRINLFTLQGCLRQYEIAGLPAPEIYPGKPAIYSFLVGYQRAFAHQNAMGQWRMNGDPLADLEKTTLVKGWIPMPMGGHMWGIVMVKDGFGHPIKYLQSIRSTWRAPCFAARLPSSAGKVITLYSAH